MQNKARTTVLLLCTYYPGKSEWTLGRNISWVTLHLTQM